MFRFDRSFGPEIRFDTGLTYATKKDINIQFGFDFNIPFNLKLHSPKGILLFTLRSCLFASYFCSSAHGHKFNITKDVEVSVGAHSIPGLFLSLTIFNVPIVALGVVMDSSIGATVSTGEFVKCPSHKVDVALYTQHDIRAEFKFQLVPFQNKAWPIASTGKIPIANLTPCSDRPPTFEPVPKLPPSKYDVLDHLVFNASSTIPTLPATPNVPSIAPNGAAASSSLRNIHSNAGVAPGVFAVANPAAGTAPLSSIVNVHLDPSSLDFQKV